MISSSRSAERVERTEPSGWVSASCSVHSNGLWWNNATQQCHIVQGSFRHLQGHEFILEVYRWNLAGASVIMGDFGVSHSGVRGSKLLGTYKGLLRNDAALSKG